MHKTFQKSSLLLMIVAANAFAMNAAHAQFLLAPPPGGFKINVEGLDIRDSQLDDPQHNIFVRPRYHWGFDLGAYYGLPFSDNDIGVDWVHLGKKNTSSTQVPAFPPFGNLVVLSDESPSYTAGFFPFSGTVVETQDTSFKYDAVTAEMGHTYYRPDFSLRFAAGIRYVPLHFTWQDASALSEPPSTGSGNGPMLTAGSLNISKSATFNGVGPHFSAQGDYNFWNSGFYLVGNLGAGLLSGKANSSVSGASFASFQTIGDTPFIFNFNDAFSSHAQITVPELDGKIGIAFTYLCHHSAFGPTGGEGAAPVSELTVEAGWRGWSYFNALREGTDPLAIGTATIESGGKILTTPLPLSQVPGAVFTTVSHNYTASGPYVSVSYSFS
jgi:hypothetical protein